MPLFHLQERHKKGIRCESGTVPATVNPLVKTENLSTFATVALSGRREGGSLGESQETCLYLK